MIQSPLDLKIEDKYHAVKSTEELWYPKHGHESSENDSTNIIYNKNINQEC